MFHDLREHLAPSSLARKFVVPSGPVQSHHEAVTALCLSPDGTSLLSASEDGYLRLFEVGRNTEKCCIHVGHPIK